MDIPHPSLDGVYGGANPKLLDSTYTVKKTIPNGGPVPVMVLLVKRHGTSGNRVSVMGSKQKASGFLQERIRLGKIVNFSVSE